MKHKHMIVASNSAKAAAFDMQCTPFRQQGLFLRCISGIHTAVLPISWGCALRLLLFAMQQDFTEWSQCQVLELAAHYRCSGEPEVYDLLNALEDRLSHNNSAVVIAAIKVFLHQTLSMTATHQQVSNARTVHCSCCFQHWGCC